MIESYDYDYDKNFGELPEARQDVVALGLTAGLILSGLAAAVVGSLVAAGLTRLTDIHVAPPIDHIDIDLPGSALEYEDEDNDEATETTTDKNSKRRKLAETKTGGGKWRQNKRNKFAKYID